MCTQNISVVGQTTLHHQKDSDSNNFITQRSAIKSSSGATTNMGQIRELFVHNDRGRGQSSGWRVRSLTMTTKTGHSAKPQAPVKPPPIYGIITRSKQVWGSTHQTSSVDTRLFCIWDRLSSPWDGGLEPNGITFPAKLYMSCIYMKNMCIAH